MKLGLALSGGGVRCAAEIGVIKALEEAGIKANAVAGTSAGSMVAVLYAMGYSPEVMLEMFNYFSKDIISISPKYMYTNIKESGSIKLKGLIASTNIEAILEVITKEKGVKYLYELKIPISIPATDLISCREIVFTSNYQAEDYYIRDIEIAKAVRASAAFPGVYTPLEYKEYQFIDGGVFDNLPVVETRKLGADKVLAVKFNLKNKRKNKTIYNIGMQAIDLMSENLVKDSIKESDYLLNLDLRETKVFSINKINFCYQEGYRQAKEKIYEIQQMLK